MEQNNEPRKKLVYMESSNLQQRAKAKNMQ